MSSTYAEPLDRLAACLDDIAAIDPGYRTVTEKHHHPNGTTSFTRRP